MRKNPVGVFWWLVFVFDGGGAAALAFGLDVHWLVAWLASVNAVTLLLYGYDKRAAMTGRLRVPERLLHLHALIGGSPAAIAAQQLFRHKAVKGSFQLVTWLIVIIQIAAIGAYVWSRPK